VRQKTAAELQAMRDGGRLLATFFQNLRAYVSAGMSERAIDAWSEQEIRRLGAEPTYKDANIGFPGVICISVNDAIVHSIPTDYILQKGDVVGFDLVVTYKGMKTDSAFTMVIGESKPTGDVARLLQYTERSLYAGIDAIGKNTRTGDVAAAIEKVLRQGKLGIVRELVGHGIGHEMHEEPEVPNYGKAGTGRLLEPGMTIAIEPMAMLGSERVVMDASDGWTIRTVDGSLSAHFEHTVLITENGAEILTTL
jgi:methionyl aminopeptidase